jgi:hypothetical protein
MNSSYFDLLVFAGSCLCSRRLPDSRSYFAIIIDSIEFDRNFGCRNARHSSTLARHCRSRSEPTKIHNYFLEDFDVAIRPACDLHRRQSCHQATVDGRTVGMLDVLIDLTHQSAMNIDLPKSDTSYHLAFTVIASTEY